MGLKILHSADWHLDTPFSGLDPHRRARLREALRQIPQWIAQVCLREKIDLVLLAGDIFDGRPRRETLEAVKAALERCAVPVFVTPGNHDYLCPGSPWLEELWPENVQIFSQGLESFAIPALNCRVWGAGYRSMDCPGMLEGFRAQCRETFRIGVLHGDPTAVNSPYSPVTAAQVHSSNLHYLALGHIHKAGSFHAGSTLCAWPGCPMGRGWDECGEKGAYIVTLEEEARLQWLPFPGIRFWDLEAWIIGDPLETLYGILPCGETEDYYRVTLTGSGDPEPGQLKNAFPGIPNLWFRDHTEPPIDLWAAEGEDTLEGIFFRLLRSAAEESQGKEQEQLLLAAKLSRRLLEGREVNLP